MFIRSILLAYIVQLVIAQENAGTNVARDLQQCYNTTRYVTRDYRLPATINVLVELIRKVEDGNPNEDAREIAVQLLHRFHQDGIQKTRKTIDSSLGLPYSPKGIEAYKNRVLLKQIIPGNAFNFNNDSLSVVQGCSLHFMISSTIERQIRNDETSTCRSLGRYTSRQKRQAEVLSTESDQSSCPIESGVVYTKWGDVKAGLVLSGIAAGYQPNPTTKNNYRIESTYASTLAGELAEVILNIGTKEKFIGNKGGWNSSIEQKYYFLESNLRENLYFTDAEIRGSLDGLLLSLNIQNWLAKFSQLKVSQILDLYYNRGVFNSSVRACNRKQLFTRSVIDGTLANQTVGFGLLLDPESQLGYTLNPEALPAEATSMVTVLKNYLNSNLKDLVCSTEEDLKESISSDVLIFIDPTWQHKTIQPLLSYLLENLQINKYESSYTLLSGSNAEVIIPKTRSILDFHEYFNLTQQQIYPNGFDYNKVLDKAQTIFQQKLDNKTDLTGQSQILLLLPHKAPTSNENDYAQTKRNNFRSLLPDLRIIVVGSDDKSTYNQFVTSPSSDAIQITETNSQDDLKNAVNSIVDRFKKIPRSVANPECGSSFSTSSSSFELINYVEPSAINYYKVSPNYFFDGQTLQIKGQGYGTIVVCTSRTEPNPQSNATQEPCKTLTSDEYSVDIRNYCDDFIGCSPIYISVQGQDSTTRCSDPLCRFPDNIKYSIALNDVHCSRSTSIVIPTLLLSILLFIMMQF